MRRLTSFALALVLSTVGQWQVPAAWAQSANACVPDSCKRLQLWSNYAALHSEDGKYLVVNASFECFDSTAAVEVDIVATQGNTTADLGSGGPEVLACDGKLQTFDFAAEVPEGASPFEANRPVDLKMRLYNGITELRVDSTQTVQPKGGTAGTRSGLEFGIERVAFGYADPRLQNTKNFTITIYYNCPTGYPGNGSLRAAQSGGTVVGSAPYELTCDGTNRAMQVEVTVYKPTIEWAVGPVELINQLGGGDVSGAQAVWQRIGELQMAAQAELPVIGRRISSVQADECASIPEGSAPGTPVTIGTCEDHWTAATDGTITHANGLCIDGSGESVVVATCDGSDRQKWTLNPREKNFSISTASKCLAPANGTIDTGTKLVLSDCVDSGGYQGWWLT